MRPYSSRPEPFVRNVPIPEGGIRGPGSALLRRMSVVLILLAIPASLVWVPLFDVPGAGNVALSDVMLSALWVLTLFRIRAVRGERRVLRSAVAIALLPLVVGALAAFGAFWFSGRLDSAILELSIVAKKYGLAAVIPVAVVSLPTASLATAARPVISLTLVANAVFAQFPAALNALPAATFLEARTIQEGRASGLIVNPNDLAYVSVGLAVIYFSLVPASGSGRSFLTRALHAGVAIAAAFNIIASGSRSGLVGAAVAAMFYFAASGAPVARRFLLVGAVLGVTTLGLAYSEVFAERVTRAYSEGFAEQNVAGRLDAQRAAAFACFEHPAGVGSRNVTDVVLPFLSSRSIFLGTTDSLYFDTLLTAGIGGLVALLALLWKCWCFLGYADSPHRRHLLRSGFVAFAVIASASVAPASVAVAPTFFFLIAASRFRSEGA